MICPVVVASELAGSGGARIGSVPSAEGVTGALSRGRRGAGHADAGSDLSGDQRSDSLVSGGGDPRGFGADHESVEDVLREEGLRRPVGSSPAPPESEAGALRPGRGGPAAVPGEVLGLQR